MQRALRIRLKGSPVEIWRLANNRDLIPERVIEEFSDKSFYLNPNCERWIEGGTLYILFPRIDALPGEKALQGKLVASLPAVCVQELGFVYRPNG
ncbi:MAG: hypothetical protein LiPW15_480 [Parcubacteria group bacterium LiPW_15]|nr:MAG: hypothetical protein LiPW15_480 [Parcubacteria group bacterium LiPW_15]